MKKTILLTLLALIVIIAAVVSDPISNIINDNSSLWSLLATIATVVYVVLTYRLLKETQRVRQESNRPYVVVDIHFKKTFLYFVVKNIGNAPAVNLTISTDPHLSSNFNNLKYLPPDKEFSENLLLKLDNKKSHVVFAEINYYNVSGKKYSEKFEIDVYSRDSWLVNSIDTADSIQELTTQIGEFKTVISAITKQLENISKKIK